jgi:hypothetical protein
LTTYFDVNYLLRSIGSKWINMNLFSISPNPVGVDQGQAALIKLLEKQGLDVICLQSRHSRMTGLLSRRFTNGLAIVSPGAGSQRTTVHQNHNPKQPDNRMQLNRQSGLRLREIRIT